MKRKRKEYTVSHKRLARDEAQRNWKYRLEIATLMLKGKTEVEIAKKYGVTPQAISDVWLKIKHMKVSEIEAKLGSKITISLE